MFLFYLASTFATWPYPVKSIELCLDDTSNVLERSGDPASEVAQATVEVCYVGKGDPKPGTIGAEEMTADDYRKFQGRLRDLALSQVQRKVVRLRACRKTPGCNVAAISLRDKSDLHEPN